jgi:hypothetical protein
MQVAVPVLGVARSSTPRISGKNTERGIAEISTTTSR